MRRAAITLLAAVAAAAGGAAAPPVVTLPAEVPGEVSAFVTVRATIAGAAAAKFVALDPGLSVFPAGMLKDETATVVVAQKAGRFRLLSYAGNQDGASEPAVTTVVIGTAPPPVTRPPDKPTDPDKPAPPSGRRFFQVVYPSGVGRPAAVVAAMKLPAWAEVSAAGHGYAEMPLGELPQAAQEKLKGRALPLLLTWEYVADGRTIRLPDPPVIKPMPTTDADIRGLLK